MDEIARFARVSKATVSRALQGSPLVSSATKDRVSAVASKHGYMVNRNARRLWANRANTIAVVLHLPPSSGKAVSAPFIFQLLAAVSRALAIRHQDVLLRSADASDSHEYQTLVTSKLVDGLLASNSDRQCHVAGVREFRTPLSKTPFNDQGALDAAIAIPIVIADGI
jgi:DNA-binding LacI/PurR family transcriptional regulator